jgi:hypothetical protein
MLVGTQGDYEAWIVPHSVEQGYFYVTVLLKRTDRGWLVEGIKRPVRQDTIEATLSFLRFPLEGVNWHESECGPGWDFNRWLYDSHADYMQRGILQ